MTMHRPLLEFLASGLRSPYAKPPPTQAVVLFSKSDKQITKVLRKGFQHCAVLLPLSQGYLLYDLNSRGLRIAEVKGVALEDIYDLAGKEDVALLTTEVIIPDTPIKIPLCFTCVELVKRVLGIKAWYIITPYQLYKHLQANCQV